MGGLGRENYGFKWKTRLEFPFEKYGWSILKRKNFMFLKEVWLGIAKWSEREIKWYIKRKSKLSHQKVGLKYSPKVKILMFI